MLNDRHNLDLTEVKEELVKLLLVSAVQNEVGSEDKDGSREDRQESLKANNPVQKHVRYTCSRTIIRKSMKPLANFLIVELIMYLNWVKS